MGFQNWATPPAFVEWVEQLRRRAVDDEHAAECLNWYEAGLYEGREASA